MLLDDGLLTLSWCPNRPQAFIKLTNSVGWTYYPYFCGVTRSDLTVTITIVVDMVFYQDSTGASLVRAFARAHAAQLLSASGGRAEARSVTQTSSLPCTPL